MNKIVIFILDDGNKILVVVSIDKKNFSVKIDFIGIFF